MSDKPAKPTGIPCPRCGGTLWKADKLRPAPNRVVRVRTCKGCRLRIRTAERFEAVHVPEPRPTTQQKTHTSLSDTTPSAPPTA